MPISAFPKQHKVQMGVSPTQRLVFVFNYPTAEQYAAFNSARFRMHLSPNGQEYQDTTTEALRELADDLLADFYGEQMDDEGNWTGDEVLGPDDQPIDKSQPGWQSKVSPVYKLKAAGWITRLAEAEDVALKNS